MKPILLITLVLCALILAIVIIKAARPQPHYQNQQVQSWVVPVKGNLPVQSTVDGRELQGE